MAALARAFHRQHENKAEIFCLRVPIAGAFGFLPVIKTVIVDLGKVLIPFDYSRGYRALEKHCPYAAAEISKRLDATDLVYRFETGLIEPADFADEISRVLASPSRPPGSSRRGGGYSPALRLTRLPCSLVPKSSPSGT
jgi:hypothetical protein